MAGLCDDLRATVIINYTVLRCLRFGGFLRGGGGAQSGLFPLLSVWVFLVLAWSPGVPHPSALILSVCRAVSHLFSLTTAARCFYPFLNTLYQRCHRLVCGAQPCPVLDWSEPAVSGHVWHGAAKAIPHQGHIAPSQPAPGHLWSKMFNLLSVYTLLYFRAWIPKHNYHLLIYVSRSLLATAW